MPTNQLITNQNKFLHEVINNILPASQTLFFLVGMFIEMKIRKKIKEQMLELQWKYQVEGDYREKEKLSETITQLDQRIDRMLYGLYGLTKEEIAIIEKEIGGK